MASILSENENSDDDSSVSGPISTSSSSGGASDSSCPSSPTFTRRWMWALDLSYVNTEPPLHIKRPTSSGFAHQPPQNIPSGDVLGQPPKQFTKEEIRSLEEFGRQLLEKPPVRTEMDDWDTFAGGPISSFYQQSFERGLGPPNRF